MPALALVVVVLLESGAVATKGACATLAAKGACATLVEAASVVADVWV
jgi:hypothetical protein